MYVLLFSKKPKNQKMKKTKNHMCAVSSLGTKQNYLQTPFHMMYTYTHQC